MKYIKQLLIIIAFSFVGEALAELIPLPIPAAIYGLVLLLIALMTGCLKPEAIADTARFGIQIMPILFVAPAVDILENWGLISGNIVPILVIMVVSTFIVFIVSGIVTQLLLRKDGDKNG